MKQTKTMSITLPAALVEAVQSKVMTGEYVNESEVIQEGLRTLFAHEEQLDGRLRRQIGQAYDNLKADPSQALTSAQVREQLSQLYRSNQ